MWTPAVCILVAMVVAAVHHVPIHLRACVAVQSFFSRGGQAGFRTLLPVQYHVPLPRTSAPLPAEPFNFLYHSLDTCRALSAEREPRPSKCFQIFQLVVRKSAEGLMLHSQKCYSQKLTMGCYIEFPSFEGLAGPASNT
jgi:hypothetical protein